MNWINLVSVSILILLVLQYQVDSLMSLCGVHLSQEITAESSRQGDCACKRLGTVYGTESGAVTDSLSKYGTEKLILKVN